MELSHIDHEGNARMVDVSAKDATLREAVAEGFVTVSPETLALIRDGQMKKGDVLGVARIAGIQAAKHTADVIPLCHPLLLTNVAVNLTLEDAPCRVAIRATVKCKGETGVEMEALNAVCAAALTVYDMCKAVQKDMTVEGVRLLSKTGGKSGDYTAQ